jgi:hypothetical protein
MEIPKWMCWGCSSTISKEDFLKVNGQDEVWDGAICGTDMELGSRLIRISSTNRIVSNNLIYELNDIPYKHNIRNDVKFREICNYQGIEGNCWKPTSKQFKEYERWHLHELKQLDDNWNRMVDVPYINIQEEYNLKRLGNIVYTNIGVNNNDSN